MMTGAIGVIGMAMGGSNDLQWRSTVLCESSNIEIETLQYQSICPPNLISLTLTPAL